MQKHSSGSTKMARGFRLYISLSRDGLNSLAFLLDFFKLRFKAGKLAGSSDDGFTQ